MYEQGPKRRWSGRLMGTMLLGAVACVDGVTDPARRTTAGLLTFDPQAQIDSALQGRNSRAIEDEILRIEGRRPGLGGIFVDSTGALVVYLRSLGDTTTLRSELIDVL